MLITGGDFISPLTLQGPHKAGPPAVSRQENGRALFTELMDRLGNALHKGSATKTVGEINTLAGRQRGQAGLTGLILKENDPDWFLNVIYSSSYNAHNGLKSHDALKRVFENIHYTPGY